jgi:uncharacterized OB-fold protein
MSRALECSACGRRSFYEKRRCLDCGSDAFEEVDPGTGELLAVTTVEVTPAGVREPNALGIAAFDGDANVVAQLDDPAAVAVGDSVRLEGDHDLRQAEDGPIVGPRLVVE